MLARTVLSAKELKITQWERDGLLLFCERVESGEITDRDHSTPLVFAHGCRFDMSTALAVEACGTVACIGGWVASTNPKWGRRGHHYVGGTRGALRQLYFPDEHKTLPWEQITAAQAAEVTRHFLATGVVDWSLIQ